MPVPTLDPTQSPFSGPATQASATAKFSRSTTALRAAAIFARLWKKRRDDVANNRILSLLGLATVVNRLDAKLDDGGVLLRARFPSADVERALVTAAFGVSINRMVGGDYRLPEMPIPKPRPADAGLPRK